MKHQQNLQQSIPTPQFQFLIGKMKTSPADPIIVPSAYWFQFLIGKMKTATKTGKLAQLYQFHLIGKMKTDLPPMPSQLPGLVSIPHR